jgi:hypothetical protein
VQGWLRHAQLTTTMDVKDVGTWHVATGQPVSKKPPSQRMGPGYGY